MEIKINNKDKPEITGFFIQTLSLLFFPEDNTFGKNKSGNFINIFIDKINIIDVEIRLEICYNNIMAERNIISRSERLMLEVGRAFYEAAGELTRIYPPWGIHTGIRPAKIADKDLEILTNDYLMSGNKARLAHEININGRQAINNKIDARDFSLYIAIPFCPTRCGYCSFVSYATPKLLKLVPEYIKKLINELEIISRITRDLDMRLRTVYIGGGTPAILSESELELVLLAVRDNFDLENMLEYTVECGRADVITQGKLEILKSHGVDRVSVNPQSLNNKVLEINGRNHTAEQFFEAYGLARDAGIKNINTDMIAGLPGEAGASMIDTASRLVKLRPENITVHTLCIKKSAEIKKSGGYNPDSPELNQVLEACYDIMRDAGYKPYYLYRQKYSMGNLENTGFSLSGRECLYNIYMMDELQTIFGAGAGAMTKLIKFDKAGDRIERIANYKYPFEYIAHDFKIAGANNKLKLKILKG